MPNWKSYESSVRLLAAIIAAHPGLKLNYDAVASKYGEENGGDSSSRPKSTPRKRATKTKKTSSASDDEDTENMKTPSKTTLNKVASGRVTKKTAPRPASKKVTNYAEPASDEEEDEEMIKGEPHGEPEGFEDINYSNGNGHSHSNGNGYHNNGYSHHHNMHAESYTGAVDDNDNAYFDAEEA